MSPLLADFIICLNENKILCLSSRLNFLKMDKFCSPQNSWPIKYKELYRKMRTYCPQNLISIILSKSMQCDVCSIFCSPAVITIFVLAVLHIEYFSLPNQPCYPPQCSASYPASTMISFPRSRLHSDSFMLGRFLVWLSSLSDNTLDFALSPLHSVVSVFVCLYVSVSCLPVYIQIYICVCVPTLQLCHQSHQSDHNQPQAFLKQADHTLTLKHAV